MPDTTAEDQPNSDPTTAAETPKSVSRTPTAWKPEPTWQKWAVPLALLLAVAAIALSIWSLTSSSKSSDTKLAGDPKTRVCTAFGTVTNGVALQTHADLGPEPVAQQAVAANARLALIGGGQYLLSQLDSATPSNLADPVRSFANQIQDIGINALAGAQNSDAQQANRLTQADLTRRQIVDLCK